MVGELRFRTSLPRTGTTSRDARHDLGAWLPERCGSSTAETALLLASELVTNAVVHTRSADVAVRATCNGDTLRIAVDDEGTPPVGPEECCSRTTTGVGLTLVDSLAARWGYEPLTTGKRVWFEIPCTGRKDGTGPDSERPGIRDASRT